MTSREQAERESEANAVKRKLAEAKTLEALAAQRQAERERDKWKGWYGTSSQHLEQVGKERDALVEALEKIANLKRGATSPETKMKIARRLAREALANREELKSDGATQTT